MNGSICVSRSYDMGLKNEPCPCHSRMFVAGIQPYTATWMPDKLVPVQAGIHSGMTCIVCFSDLLGIHIEPWLI